MGDFNVVTTQNSWANFSNYLQNAFKTQYGAQSGIYNFLTTTFTNMINNPNGFSQAALASLRGSTVQNIATQYNSARQTVQNNMAANGSFGSDVKSGVNAQIMGQIAGGQAAATASGLDQIEQANEEQKIKNQQIGEEGLMDVAAGENPLGFSSAANSAAGTVGQLGVDEAQINAEQNQNSLMSQLGGSFFKGLGGGLGSALGGSANAGLESVNPYF